MATKGQKQVIRTEKEKYEIIKPVVKVNIKMHKKLKIKMYKKCN